MAFAFYRTNLTVLLLTLYIQLTRQDVLRTKKECDMFWTYAGYTGLFDLFRISCADSFEGFPLILPRFANVIGLSVRLLR